MALDDLIHWYSGGEGLLKAKVAQEFNDDDNISKYEVIVVKKHSGLKIGNSIGEAWRTYNIIETESLSIDLIKRFYLTLSFAYKFQADRYKSERLSINDITVNILQDKIPKAFFEYMSQYQYREMTKISDGIYTISDEFLPIRMLVSRELPRQTYLWLKDLIEIPENGSSSLKFY